MTAKLIATILHMFFDLHNSIAFENNTILKTKRLECLATDFMQIVICQTGATT